MIRFAKGVYIIAALVRTWVIIRYVTVYCMYILFLADKRDPMVGPL